MRRAQAWLDRNISRQRRCRGSSGLAQSSDCSVVRVKIKICARGVSHRTTQRHGPRGATKRAFDLKFDFDSTSRFIALRTSPTDDLDRSHARRRAYENDWNPSTGAMRTR
jgi:hypothetical protein